MDSKHPHKQRGTREHHGERSHGRDTTEVPLSIILLGVTGAYIQTLYISGTTLLDQRPPYIFPDVVADKIKWDSTTATKVCK